MSAPAAPLEPMGHLDRVIGTLLDPKLAFADLAARPTGWWLPLALLMVVTVGFIFAFTQRVGWERFMRQQMEQNPRVQQMPVEQREQILQQQLRFVPAISHIQGAVAWPLITLVTGGVFLFVFNILLGGQLTFRQVYAVVCYGNLPHGLGAVLALVVMFIKDPADFDLQNPVASNLGAFLDPTTTPKWLVSAAGSVDLFSAWVVLLLATGFAAAARKISWSKSFTWVVITWLLWVVVKSGASWIFS
jgi:hypothetical protein